MAFFVSGGGGEGGTCVAARPQVAQSFYLIRFPSSALVHYCACRFELCLIHNILCITYNTKFLLVRRHQSEIYVYEVHAWYISLFVCYVARPPSFCLFDDLTTVIV